LRFAGYSEVVAEYLGDIEYPESTLRYSKLVVEVLEVIIKYSGDIAEYPASLRLLSSIFSFCIRLALLRMCPMLLFVA
jgi:hypothetical protein